VRVQEVVMQTLALIRNGVMLLGLVATVACRSPVRTQAAGMLVPIDPPVEQPGPPDIDATQTPDATSDAFESPESTLGDIIKLPTPVEDKR
jgi:hypothetical protein